MAKDGREVLYDAGLSESLQMISVLQPSLARHIYKIDESSTRSARLRGQEIKRSRENSRGYSV